MSKSQNKKRQRRGHSSSFRIRKPGKVFLMTMLPVMLAAWNTGTNLLYLVLGALLSFLVLSVLLPCVSMRKLSVACDAPRAVFRCQKFRIHLCIANESARFTAISIRVESAAAPGLSLGYALKVPTRSKVEIPIEETLDKRGVYPLARYELVSSFPFGLVEYRRRFKDQLEIVVYPRVTRVRTTVIEHMSSSCSMARVASPDGDEFYSLREYVAGDDMRHIAWRISARKGKWMIREMSRDNSRFVIFILDSRRLAHIEDFDEHFEEAVELAASLAVTFLGRQFNVALETPGGSLEFGEGKAQERRILESLARVQSVAPEAHAGFDDIARQLESHQAALIYLSPDPLLWGRRNAQGSMRILDPRELVYG